MTATGAPAGPLAGALAFDLPDELIATEPIEAAGLRRDDARLLVSWRSQPRLVDTTFRSVADFLEPGDLMVVNTSATLPAAVPAGEDALVHLCTELPDGTWVVELRTACGAGSRPRLDGRAGTGLDLPAGGRVELLAPYPAPTGLASPPGAGQRLWAARLSVPGPLHDYLGAVGRPIRYGCTAPPVPLAAYQSVFALEPGSAEMPSAGRAFTVELVRKLAARGVDLAPIVLHTGVSSQETGEAPYPERFRVPAGTAERVNLARRRGHRVIAVGTTVTRALETTVDAHGRSRAAAGWTELVISPATGVRVVDGLLTGWHEPRATHLCLLEAVGGRALVERSYAAALAARYRWHQFGDLHLVLP